MQSGHKENFVFNEIFLIDYSNLGLYLIVQKHSGRILKRLISQDLNKVSSESPISGILRIRVPIHQGQTPPGPNLELQLEASKLNSTSFLWFAGPQICKPMVLITGILTLWDLFLVNSLQDTEIGITKPPPRALCYIVIQSRLRQIPK